MKPLFSCVVPVKGARPFMDEALASLRAQEMGEELEIIVQDGDAEADAGLSDALNRGFAKAHGEWFFWLNADDVLLPGALKAVKALIGSSAQDAGSADWIAGNDVFLDEGGKVIRCAWDRGWKCCCRKLPVQVYGPSSFFRRGLFESSGGFDTSFRFAMDVDLWCRFRKDGYWFAKLPRYVWGFRVHGGSVTHSRVDGDWSAAHAEENVRLCRKSGFVESRFAKSVARTVRLLNGSYLRAAIDTARFRGCDWREVR